ncbi:MAG: iron-sulfur cluster assembly accessory protein [Candidatus Binatia bacterium]|jgi:iron-sulfur cluster assembly protein|nr:iron-sulfur cluster assembly accessory protein [Candidatus Binatia bacterium]
MPVGVTITDRAAKRINEIVTPEARETQGLRLKVIGGGCSGLQNKMDIDTPHQGDRVFEKEGARVIVDMKSLLYLTGTELDYQESVMQSGFVLQNPNVKRSCGCGVSFAV